jgi:hypothetical protein
MNNRFLSLLLTVVSFSESCCWGFTASNLSHDKKHPNVVSQKQEQSPKSTLSTTQLNVGNLFGGIFASNKEETEEGPKTIIDIPVTSLKVGPLKFYLQIFLVGEQNKPLPNSWVLNQNDDRGTLDYYFTDGTGMISIDCTEYQLKILRYGQKPSLQYVLQESVLLHSLLDELTTITFADDIEAEKRLLQLLDNTAFDKARGTLPARKADDG